MRTRFFVVATAMATGLVLTSCSSSATHTGSSTAPTVGSTSSGTAASSGSAQAAAYLSKYLAPPTSIGLSQPLTRLPKGSTVYFMMPGIPLAASFNQVAQQAGKALGLKVVIRSEGASPSDIAAAWDQAVAAKPAAVLAGGVSTDLVGNQLTELKAAKIPVVIWTAPQTPATTPTIVANMQSSDTNAQEGKLAAGYMAAYSKSTVHAVYVNVTEFAVLASQADAAKQNLLTWCASCSLDALSIPESALADGSFDSKVVAYLQAHPSVNWLWLSFQDLETGMPQALADAGLSGKVQIGVQGDSASVHQDVAAGKTAVAIGFPSGIMVYAAFDAAARAIVGDDLTQDVTWAATIPTQVLDKQTVSPLPSDGIWPGVAGYQAAFAKLWGVTS